METYNHLMAFVDSAGIAFQDANGKPTVVDWKECEKYVTDQFPEFTNNRSSSETAPLFTISMGEGEFAPEILLESAIRSFKRQLSPVRLESLDIIRQFYSSSSKSSNWNVRTFQIALELLYTYSKLSVDEIHYYAESSSGEKCYGQQLHDLVESLWTWTEGSTIYVNDSKAQRIKEFLQNGPIIEALRYCLGKRFQFDADGCCDVTSTGWKFRRDGLSIAEWIIKEIGGMKIYFTDDKSIPLKGAAVRDGVLIFHSYLIAGGRYCREAELMTLAVHECCHYLARKFTDDYSYHRDGNFSWSEKTDGISKGLNYNQQMELGRAVELVIFDGEQPDWVFCKEHVAKRFIDRAADNDRPPLPLIRKEEYKSLGFKSREKISITSGLEFFVAPFFVH